MYCTYLWLGDTIIINNTWHCTQCTCKCTCTLMYPNVHVHVYYVHPNICYLDDVLQGQFPPLVRHSGGVISTYQLHQTNHERLIKKVITSISLTLLFQVYFLTIIGQAYNIIIIPLTAVWDPVYSFPREGSSFLEHERRDQSCHGVATGGRERERREREKRERERERGERE